MTALSKSTYLKFHPETIQEIRKEFNLDKHGLMDQSIDILHDWIQKQDHFVKKEFCREYLERVIISAKGSVERAKKRIDKMCTMRTMLPILFEKCNTIKDFKILHEHYTTLVMPEITEDNYRILIAKLTNKKLSSSAFLEGYQYTVIMCEYLKRYDYTHGTYIIVDLRDANLFDFANKLDIIDLRKFMTMYTDGYGIRIKAIYVLSTSTMIGTIIDIFKQVVSAKVGQRILVLKTIESLHERLSKRFLPEDYDGDQKSIETLCKEFSEELSKEEHVAYIKEIREARTNETLRSSVKFNEEYLGMPGSLKVLSFD